MKLGTALKTKTRKIAVVGTLLAAVMPLGLAGTASAQPYRTWNNNNNYWNNYGQYHRNRNTCYDAFWVYNRDTGRWFRVGYNERTDQWEVCRRNYDYNNDHRWSNDHNRDHEDDNDQNYWQNNRHNNNDHNRYSWSNNGRRNY